MILSHADTSVVGPYSASELVDRFSRLEFSGLTLR